MYEIFNEIDSLYPMKNNYFPPKTIPIIYKEEYGYIIHIKDLEYLNEIYGISLNEALDIVLDEHNILYEESYIAINEYKIIDNPYIINEFNNIIIIPHSNNSIESRYIDYILEQSDYMNNPDLFIYKGIVYNKYIDEFLLNEGIIDRARNLGNDIKTAASIAGQAISNTAQRKAQDIQSQYNTQLNNITGGEEASRLDKFKAGTSVVKNNAAQIGQNMKNSITRPINGIRAEYQTELNRIPGVNAVNNMSKAKAAGIVAKRHMFNGMTKTLDALDNIPDISGDALDFASSVILPDPMLKGLSTAIKNRTAIKFGVAMAQMELPRKKAALKQKIQQLQSQLSAAQGNAKIILQDKINSLKQSLQDLTNKSNNN